MIVNKMDFQCNYKSDAHRNVIIARAHLMAFVRGMSYLSGSLLIIMLFFLLGPGIEDEYFPAFGPVNITVMSREATDRNEFHIVGTVLRSCKYIRIGAMTKIDGDWHAATIHTPDIPKDFMIPRGKQDFGRLQIFPKGDGIKVIVENQCHPFWINHTYYTWP